MLEMKYPRLILGALFLTSAFSSLGINGENNVTTVITENFSEVSTENEKPDFFLSEDEIILERWRKMERLLKSSASTAVKGILPSILRVNEGIDISSRCSRSIMKMLYGIKELKLWASKMIDASGKFPNGILSGYLSSLGDFDGCLSVDVPGSNPFRGQYCTVFIDPPLPKRKLFQNPKEIFPVFANFSKEGTLMHQLARRSQYFAMLSLRTSLCVPSTCSQKDVQTIIDRMVALTEFPWQINIPTCDVIEPLAFSKTDIVIICVLGAIGFLAFIATVTDVVLNIISKEKRIKVEATSTAVKCLMCFSTYNNTLRLLKEDISPDSIKIFHGLKVITLLWVMLNHSYYFTNFNVLGGVVNAQDFGKQTAFQMVLNGFLNVETFFFISAVLVAYGRMKFTGKHISVPLYIFRRVWRLTPPLMLIIATSILIPHMGSGPAWKDTIGNLIDKCRANWWTNLLFINNFISTKDVCFQWLWYIPVDMHLYILALLVIVPLKSHPRLALGIDVILFISGTVTTAATHIYYKHHPTYLSIFPHEDDRYYFADKSFFRSYTHITTTCIGLYVGYTLAIRPKLKIPTILNIFGWLCSMIFGLLVVYGAYDWNQGNIPGMVVSTIYMCTNKVVWALALGYITIACFTGNGGIITSILSWSALVPLSRLTYVAYIIHPIIQLMFVGSTRVSLQLDHKTIVYRYLANIIASYTFAYVISLLFESPFMCLEKIMFSRRPTPEVSQKSNPEEKVADQLKCSESGIFTVNIKKLGNEEPQ